MLEFLKNLIGYQSKAEKREIYKKLERDSAKEYKLRMQNYENDRYRFIVSEKAAEFYREWLKAKEYEKIGWIWIIDPPRTLEMFIEYDKETSVIKGNISEDIQKQFEKMKLEYEEN